jgi:hypothetical protein
LYGAIYLAQKAYNDLCNKQHHEEEPIIIKQQKQIAFTYGLWHGIVIGMIGAGLLFKYSNDLFHHHQRR